MAKRRTLNTVVLVILIAGAVAFAMLLAGVGAGLLTKATPYAP